jgi:hypothetical protein
METLKWIKTTLKSIEGRTQNVGDIKNIENDCTSSGISLRRDPGSLRERTNKAKPFESKYQSYMKYVRGGKRDLPRYLRFVTFPSDNKNAKNIKVLSATRSPYKCCLANPFQNYAQVVSRLDDSLKAIDMTLGHNSTTLERYIIPPTNDIPSNCKSLYR